jgi:hypothetical protein
MEIAACGARFEAPQDFSAVLADPSYIKPSARFEVADVSLSSGELTVEVSLPAVHTT